MIYICSLSIKKTILKKKAYITYELGENKVLSTDGFPIVSC